MTESAHAPKAHLDRRCGDGFSAAVGFLITASGLIGNICIHVDINDVDTPSLRAVAAAAMPCTCPKFYVGDFGKPQTSPFPALRQSGRRSGMRDKEVPNFAATPAMLATLKR